MTYKQNTCHWCGAEANSTSRIACKKHLKLSKKKNRETYIERVTFAREHGLCVVCYKEPQREGYITCIKCGEKHVKYQRKMRELKSQRIYDEIIDRDYITVDKAASIMKVNRSTILHIIHRKLLTVRCMYKKAFYVSEADVYELRKHYVLFNNTKHSVHQS